MTMNAPEWYALHTKPKQEKRAFLNLEAWGIEAFAPWLPSRAKPSNPPPLFPGYIFARFKIGELLHKIAFTRGVSNVVSFGGVPAIVEEDVIAAIRSRTDQNGIARILCELKPGDLVTAQSGPLRNLVGIFERELPESERIEILLTTIAYSARIKVSRYEVRKIEAPGSCPTGHHPIPASA
jgi:transcriptional antiterminator RfaH